MKFYLIKLLISIFIGMLLIYVFTILGNEAELQKKIVVIPSGGIPVGWLIYKIIFMKERNYSNRNKIIFQSFVIFIITITLTMIIASKM